MIVFYFMLSASAFAHHSFSAEFDGKSPVELKGTVTKVELINPHSWIHIDVPEKGKPAQKWMFEAGSPNTLVRHKVNRDSLKIGQEVTVKGYRSRDRLCKPACKANGRSIVMANGQKIFIGGSNTGAPADGEDPGEP